MPSMPRCLDIMNNGVIEEKKNGDMEEQIQRLHGRFSGKQRPNLEDVGVEEVEERGLEKKGGDERGGDGKGHVCNSLFAGCSPVALSDILGAMGNGAPGKCPQAQILALRRQLKKKDHELHHLQREIHKLRCVLEQRTTLRDGVDEVVGWLQREHSMAGQWPMNQKRQGVSAESSQVGKSAASIHLHHHDKDYKSKQIIKDALLENDLLKNLEVGQMREVVDCMYLRRCAQGSYLIKQGEAGSHLYVSGSGEFEVIKDGEVLGTMGPGKAFGELAILYNCTRTASIRVREDGEVWVLERRVFQSIMMRTGLQRLEDGLSFLHSVPLLTNLGEPLLVRIADSLLPETYPGGHYIVRQGASGDTFYIIKEGKVKVTVKQGDGEEELRRLKRGDYFGEQALLREDSRTANVVALPPGVEVLALDRESFMLLIGDLSELQEKNYENSDNLCRTPSASSLPETDPEIEILRLTDLEVVATLGVGGFGRVELVKTPSDRVFALKCMKKAHILETHQADHVYSERDVMFSARSQFICRLYKTFKDKKYVYLLEEACLGGEVWTLLRDRSCFDDATACFVVACVLEAIDYLHSRDIVYRDLKPENLMLDEKGYVKLVDFGFAKRLMSGGKTWTFCGTPEYVAPEVILNKGHGKPVDYWALGVLAYELLTGLPPFSGSDPMKTYNLILRGIDGVVFPRQVSKTAQGLIKRLCKESPAERLGAHHAGIADIRRHKWFQGFDWEGLRKRTMVPPIIPKISGPTDTSNFDIYSKDETVPPDELSNWDAEF